MPGTRSTAAKVTSCAAGAVAIWLLTVALGVDRSAHLPHTPGQWLFEVLWTALPGVVMGAYWAARGPAGRFPLFAAAAAAAGQIWAAHRFDVGADPLAGLLIVFGPLLVTCIALVGIVLTLLAGVVRRGAGRSDASP